MNFSIYTIIQGPPTQDAPNIFKNQTPCIQHKGEGGS